MTPFVFEVVWVMAKVVGETPQLVCEHFVTSPVTLLETCCKVAGVVFERVGNEHIVG